MDELTRLVVGYQVSGSDYSMLYNQISTIVYHYPRRASRCTEDDCGEFLLFFQVRIASIVQRFVYRGISFEAYLTSNLKWQLRTYLRRRDHSAAQVRFALRPMIWSDSLGRDELAVRQRAPEFTVTPPRIKLPQSEAERRRLLIITLKACLYLRESELPLIAASAACDPQWLRDCWLRLRVRLICRRSRSEELVVRRNRLFVLLYGVHHRMWQCSDEQTKVALLAELKTLKQRLVRVRRQLSRVPHSPTNLEIAEVTGVPKGTVDSTLYYAKRNLLRTVHTG